MDSQKCFLFYPDQEKADLKAADPGEVRKGQETPRAEEVWQKGWFLFCTVIITLISFYCTYISLLYISLLQVLLGSFFKNYPFNMEDIVPYLCELDLPSCCIIDEWKVQT